LVCGKGKCGKSTIVALLAKEIASRNSEVLVISTMTKILVFTDNVI
jgi:CO dehydrogenase nickel-insertion accessory protein CooC1